VLLYTITLFIGLLYFKIFRVRRQQEKLTLLQKIEGLFSIVALFTLIVFGFMTLTWYEVLIAIVLSAVMVSLIITTVQLGIFIDGKPLFKLSALYRFMPMLALLTIIGSVMSITPYYLG
jgi:hypothetical protein